MRLRWLLNALDEQSLDPALWEVVVAHDTADPETARLLAEHPLAHSGQLTALTFDPGTGSPAQRRNAGWRAAQAPLIAFTDDDCRPPPDWLANALEAARGHSGAIVQGRTTPDPDEHTLLLAPHARTQRIDPPVLHAQTCNIVYPRSVLEALDGFIEDPRLIGEDTELAARAREAGTRYVGAPEVLTHHAVESAGLASRVRGVWRWRDLPRLLKLHPSLRGKAFPLIIFWKATHLWLVVALAGAGLAFVHPAFLALTLPWAWSTSRMGRHLPARAVVRKLIQLPGRLVIDLAELAALTLGSIRHRTLFL